MSEVAENCARTKCRRCKRWMKGGEPTESTPLQRAASPNACFCVECLPGALTPGSDAAFRAGCLCPRMDNRWGAGAYIKDGRPIFWYTEGCPVHTEEAKQVAAQDDQPVGRGDQPA